MLPKKNRLDLKRELFWIRRGGRVINGEYFNFLFQKVADFCPPSFAFVISKKVEKKATKRNKIKRLLSEAVRNFLPQIQPGVKGVFFVKKEILEKKFTEIKAEIENIFKKENLFK